MGAGCGRAKLNSDGDLAIVALQGAVKTRQSDTRIENSPKGESQSNGAAENAVREEEEMIRTWKMSVEEELKAVIDNKHVLLPWLVMHAIVIITRYKTVHDGKTAYQRIKNKRPSNKMLPFGEKVVWMMPNDNHRRKKLDSIHQFIRCGCCLRRGCFLLARWGLGGLGSLVSSSGSQPISWRSSFAVTSKQTKKTSSPHSPFS